MDKQKGQTTMVLVLVVGMVAILSAVGLGTLSAVNIESEVASTDSDQARYAAWAGVDELMYRLRSHQEFPVGQPFQIDIDLQNGATVSATLEGDDEIKTVRAQGYYGDSVRRFEVEVASASGKASFLFAVQSGQGGFEMEGNSQIIGAGGTEGNVYSNGAILGTSKASGNSGSRIMGNVWAVGRVDELVNNGGVFVLKDAWADELNECNIAGDAAAPIPPGAGCTYGGDFTLSLDGPDPVELSSVDVDFWKTQAAAGGVWVGDCRVDSGGIDDCTGGTLQLGNVKIEGNLHIPSNKTTTLTGPVWVEGNINIDQNNNLVVDEAVEDESIVIVASNASNPAVLGRIVTASNIEFVRNSLGAGIIAISENTGKLCTTAPAVDITSNTSTVVFVALDGCIRIKSNSILAGVLGYKVYLSSNSTIEYDPSLAQAILGQDLGGWAVLSVREY